MAVRVTFIILLFSLVLKCGLKAQLQVPFTQRTSQYTPTKRIYNIKGDFTMIGNTNLTLSEYSDIRNNAAPMIYVDKDDDPNTFNSSSATLSFSTENNAKPQCSHIVYAGLYWTGRAHNGYSPMNFTASKKINGLLDEDFTVRQNGSIPSSDFTLEIDYFYQTAWYMFKGSNGVDINITMAAEGTIYYESYLNDVKYGFQIINGVNTNTNSGIMTASFDPVTIYSEEGGEVITINQLKRPVFNNLTKIECQYYSEASGQIRDQSGVEVTKSFDKREVFFKHADEGVYEKVTANGTDIRYPVIEDYSIYVAYAEVTDYVRAHGIGEYWLADMALREGDGGDTGYYGGWGLVVVYENSKMKWRDVTLYDGYAYVFRNESSPNSYNIPIDGFEAVQNGDVNVKLGLMAGEGDRDISGDYIQIRDASDNYWLNLNHGGNWAENFFNSSIYTGGNYRNPNLLNNTGIDIAMFNIPNANNSIIANSQTSTEFRYSTSQDAFTIFSLAMAVDAYVPEAEATNTVMTIGGDPIVDGTLVEPGQVIEYKIDIRNRGTEAVNDAKFVLPIPYTTDYVESSSSVNFPSATNNLYFDVSEGATGSIVWEIGDLPVPDEGPDRILATLNYKLRVTTDCEILSNPNCSPSVGVGGGGGSSGTGGTSGNTISGFSIIQGYETVGDCVGEPIVTPIQIIIDADDYVAANCSGFSQNTEQEFVFCNLGSVNSIDITEVSGNFPVGCRFYDSYPYVDGVTQEFTINNGFPATVGVENYYAVPPGYTDCYYSFKIAVKTISSVPTVSQLEYCLGDVANSLTAIPSSSAYNLYYFTESSGGTPKLSLVPPTDLVGSITYYVAEGESASCISSNRKAIEVKTKPLPQPLGISFE